MRQRVGYLAQNCSDGRVSGPFLFSCLFLHGAHPLYLIRERVE